MTDPGDISFRVVDAGTPQARRAMGNYFAELDQRLAGGFAPGSATCSGSRRKPSG